MGSDGGLWGWPYLAVKRTCRTTTDGGALTGRASSSPLLGEALKATGSLSVSCWPAARGGEHTQRQAPPYSAPGSPFLSISVGSPAGHLGLGS